MKPEKRQVYSGVADSRETLSAPFLKNEKTNITYQIHIETRGPPGRGEGGGWEGRGVEKGGRLK